MNQELLANGCSWLDAEEWDLDSRLRWEQIRCQMEGRKSMGKNLGGVVMGRQLDGEAWLIDIRWKCFTLKKQPSYYIWHYVLTEFLEISLLCRTYTESQITLFYSVMFWWKTVYSTGESSWMIFRLIYVSRQETQVCFISACIAHSVCSWHCNTAQHNSLWESSLFFSVFSSVTAFITNIQVIYLCVIWKEISCQNELWI